MLVTKTSTFKGPISGYGSIGLNSVLLPNYLMRKSFTNKAVYDRTYTYTSYATGINYAWTSVCWCEFLQLFVACHNTAANKNQAIMLSPNGINWNLATSTPSYNGAKIVSGNNILVMGTSSPGDTTTFTTSTDGITWTAKTSVNSTTTALEYMSDNNIYLWAGTPALMKYSTNPTVSWSAINNPAIDDLGQVNGYAYSPSLGKYVAVLSSADELLQGMKAIYSSNAVNWHIGHTPVGNYNYTSVKWSDEYQIFSAVGNACCMYSYDGINWVAGTVNGVAYVDLVYAKEFGVFMAISPTEEFGTMEIDKSYDGITYTQMGGGLVAGCSSICWSPQLMRFLIVSSTEATNKCYLSVTTPSPYYSANRIQEDTNNLVIHYATDLSKKCTLSANVSNQLLVNGSLIYGPTGDTGPAGAIGATGDTGPAGISTSTTISTNISGPWDAPLGPITVQLETSNNICMVCFPSAIDGTVTSSQYTWSFATSLPSGYYNPNHAVSCVIPIINNNNIQFAQVLVAVDGTWSLNSAPTILTGTAGTTTGGFNIVFSLV